MFATIHSYSFNQKFSRDIDQKVHDIYVPLVEKVPGFISYHWVESGNGEAVSMSVFEDKKGAMDAVHLAANFRKQHLNKFSLAAPLVTVGEVAAHSERTPPVPPKQRSAGTRTLVH